MPCTFHLLGIQSSCNQGCRSSFPFLQMSISGFGCWPNSTKPEGVALEMRWGCPILLTGTVRSPLVSFQASCDRFQYQDCIPTYL